MDAVTEPINREILSLNSCRMRLYGRGGTLLWLIGEEDAPWLDVLPEDAAVITISGMDWDRDLSPGQPNRSSAAVRFPAERHLICTG